MFGFLEWGRRKMKAFKKIFLLFFVVSVFNCGALLKAVGIDDIKAVVNEFLAQPVRVQPGQSPELKFAELTEQLKQFGTDISIDIVENLNFSYKDKIEFQLNVFKGLIARDPVVCKIVRAIEQFFTTLQSSPTPIIPRDLEEINETIAGIIGKRKITPQMMHDVISATNIGDLFGVKFDSAANTITICHQKEVAYWSAQCCCISAVAVISLFALLVPLVDWCVLFFGGDLCYLGR